MVSSTVLPPSLTFLLPRPQQFSLPSTIITYLLKSVKGLKKLYQTCKHFFAIANVLIKVFPRSILTIRLKKDLAELEKLMASNSLIWIIENMHFSPKFMPKFNKVFRFSIKRLNIFGTTLTAAEFDLIVGEKMVEFFQCSRSFIEYPDGKTKMQLDEILQRLPNITEFYYSNSNQAEQQSFKNPNSLKLNKKLKAFHLRFRSDNIDPCLLCEFIKNNAAPLADIILYIYPSGIRSEVEAAVNGMLEEWKEKEKPKITLLFFYV